MDYAWWVLAVVIVLFSGAFAYLAVAQYRMRQREKQYAATLNALREDVAALCAGAVGVGEQMVRIEQRLRKVNERQHKLQTHEPSTRPYSKAVDLVRKGAAMEDLIAQCGLTHGEAELIAMLHRADKTG